MTIRFDGEVAIVTGAGVGMGRAYDRRPSPDARYLTADDGAALWAHPHISSNGVLRVGGNAPHAAARAGLIGPTLDGAIEGQPLGILVNAVMPTSYSR